MPYQLDLDKVFIRGIFDNPAHSKLVEFNRLLTRDKYSLLIFGTLGGRELLPYFESYMRQRGADYPPPCPLWDEESKSHSEAEEVNFALAKWKDMMKQAAAETGHTTHRLVLLPRITQAETGKPLFDRIRSDILGFVNEPRPPFYTVLLCDYVTYVQLSTETDGTSSLGKELAPEVWLLKRFEQYGESVGWLTGRNYWLNKLFYPHLSNAAQNGQNLREAVRGAAHVIASQMMQPGNAECVEAQLQKLLGQEGAEGDKRGALYPNPTHLLDELCGLLPGAYDPADAYAPIGWREQKHNARWRPHALLRIGQQALLAGSFIRAQAIENDDTPRFHLSGPLLAYAVARLGMATNRWQPQHREFKKILGRPHADYVLPGGPLTPLDLFIDNLLNKALGRDVYQDDDWTVPTDINPGKLGSAAPGEWWKRLPEPEFSE